MAELADALASGASPGNRVQVQVLSSAFSCEHRSFVEGRLLATIFLRPRAAGLVDFVSQHVAGRGGAVPQLGLGK